MSKNWEKPTFGFAKQNKFGQRGEEDFLLYYPDIGLKREDGRVWDFSLNGEGVEVKSESRNLDKTPNIFCEIISNVSKNTEGAVFRAETDKCRYIIYYFINDKTFFWYNTIKLCEFIRKNGCNYDKKLIRNVSHETIGYAIPRKDIEFCCERVDKFE